MNRLGCMVDHWLFSQLAPGEKTHIERVTRKLAYKKGEILFGEGDRATAVLLVTEGRIKLFRVSEEGKEIILAFLTPHDLFGEEVFFFDSTRSMSAMAMEKTRVCVCEKSDFLDMIRKNSDFAVKVIQTLGEKLNQVTGQFVDFAMHNVKERVLDVLVRMARDYGERTPQGLHLNFRLTHEDLAALVGASRVMVTQVLQELKREDCISTDGRTRFIVREKLMNKQRQGIEEEKFPESPLCPCFEEVNKP